MTSDRSPACSAAQGCVAWTLILPSLQPGDAGQQELSPLRDRATYAPATGVHICRLDRELLLEDLGKPTDLEVVLDAVQDVPVPGAWDQSSPAEVVQQPSWCCPYVRASMIRMAGARVGSRSLE